MSGKWPIIRRNSACASLRSPGWPRSRPPRRAQLSSSSNGGTSAGATAKASAKASASAKPTGTANVAYASSLQFLNEKIVSPAFTAAEGYKFVGPGGASGDLSTESPAASSARTSSRASAGTTSPRSSRSTPSGTCSTPGTSIVVAYNPKSKYASDFKAIADGSKHVCTLFSNMLQTPGLKLGRTDPNIDPQGRDFIYMLELAQSYCKLPSDTVAKILGTSDFGTATASQIYAESSLDSTLQAGSSTRPARSSPRRSTEADLHQAARRDQPGQRRPTPPRTRRPPSRWRTGRSSRAARRSSTSPRSAPRPPPGPRSSSTPCRPPASPSTSRVASPLITPTVFGDKQRCARRDHE